MSNLVANTLISQRVDWQYTTTELFGLLSHLPWAVLLDSANANHPDARYDIIGLAPIATLTAEDDELILEHYAAQTLTLEQRDPVRSQRLAVADPFAVIQSTLTSLFPQARDSELPFSGGAMGSMSYDLGRRIEDLPCTAAQDIDFADLYIGFYQWALLYDYQCQCWHICHYGGQQALDDTLTVLNQYLDEMTFKHAFAAPPQFQLIGQWQAQISKQEYAHKFERIQQYLREGDCYQINLTQRFSAEYEGDEWQAYCQLRQTNQAPFSAFMRLPAASVLSISPERFIRLSDHTIQTKPIKGTIARSSDPETDRLAANALQASDKDRAENVMIVDLLRNDIGKVATPGSVAVPHLFEVESFPAVHHLVSTVTATLAPHYHATDLLKAAFPGGSITGAPKIRAMEIIEELEPSRRNLYCGSMVYISQDGNMDSSITIRTLIATDNHLYCWGGGGIVADSQLDAEYQESYDKLSRILPVLENC